jgi:hypothetical protein
LRIQEAIYSFVFLSTFLAPAIVHIDRNDQSATSLLTTTSNNDNSDFSLNELAMEYLQDEPYSLVSDEKLTSSCQNQPLSSVSNVTDRTNVSTISIFPSTISQCLVQDSLASILSEQHLSSHEAADAAESVWKHTSSSFGQMLCLKSNDNKTIATKRISSCLFDWFLYERLTRLVRLLPKQCPSNSHVSQYSVRGNSRGQYSQSQRAPRAGRYSNTRPSRPSHDFRPADMQSRTRFGPTSNFQQQPIAYPSHGQTNYYNDTCGDKSQVEFQHENQRMQTRSNTTDHYNSSRQGAIVNAQNRGRPFTRYPRNATPNSSRNVQRPSMPRHQQSSGSNNNTGGK